MLRYVRNRNSTDRKYRYRPPELYGFLTRRLFKDVLHKEDEYRICFAKRYGSDRTEALRAELETAKQRFLKQWGIQSSSTIVVSTSTPPRRAGLQAVDYFLWALQRLYERGEDRYVEYLWPAFRLVVDIDDRRRSRAGAYYTQKTPLSGGTVAERKEKSKGYRDA